MLAQPFVHLRPIVWRLRQRTRLLDELLLRELRTRLAGIAHQLREPLGVFLLPGDRGLPALPCTGELRRAGEFRALLAQFKLLLGFVKLPFRDLGVDFTGKFVGSLAALDGLDEHHGGNHRARKEHDDHRDEGDPLRAGLALEGADAPFRGGAHVVRHSLERLLRGSQCGPQLRKGRRVLVRKPLELADAVPVLADGLGIRLACREPCLHLVDTGKQVGRHVAAVAQHPLLDLAPALHRRPRPVLVLRGPLGVQLRDGLAGLDDGPFRKRTVELRAQLRPDLARAAPMPAAALEAGDAQLRLLELAVPQACLEAIAELVADDRLQRHPVLLPGRVVGIAGDEVTQRLQATPGGRVGEDEPAHVGQATAERTGQRDGLLDLGDGLHVDLVLHGQAVLGAEVAPLPHDVGVEGRGELEDRRLRLGLRACFQAQAGARIADGALHPAPQRGGLLGDPVRDLAHLRLVAQASGDHGADGFEQFLLACVHSLAFLLMLASGFARTPPPGPLGRIARPRRITTHLRNQA